MSLAGRSALGVDVTDGTLKAVLLSRRGRRVTLRRCWRVPFAHEPDPQVGALEALATFFRVAGSNPEARIVLSAPDRGHFSRTYQIPVMEAERIGELVRYEVLAELGTPDEDLLVRWHVRRGVVESQVHALALQRRGVDAFRAALAERRLPYDDLEPPGFALGSFVEHEMPLGRDRILLGVGELATELVLLREDGIWTRALPLGLAHEESAATLARRLATEVAAAASSLLPQGSEFRPVDVVLTEEGASSAALTRALRQVLGVPVTRVRELRRMATSGRLRLDGQTPEQALSMGKAYGLALAGLGLGRFRCPVHEGNPRRQALRQLPLAAASLLLSAVGLAGVTALADRRVQVLDAALAGDLAGEVVALAGRASQLDREIDEGRAVVAALDGLAARRPAAHGVRRALAAASEVVAQASAEARLRVDSVWIAPSQPGRPGLLTVTFHAAARPSGEVGELLAAAYEQPFPEARLVGPQDVPMLGLQRWTVEIALP